MKYKLKIALIGIFPLVLMCVGLPLGLMYKSIKVGFIRGVELWNEIDNKIRNS